MAIGSYEACIKRGALKKFMAKVFGTQDYHSHIRIMPVINVCRKKNIHGSFLEIGCGSGMVAFELWRRGHIKNYLGIDLNKDSIDWARKIQKSLGADRMSFANEDAFVFLDSTNTGGGV